MNRNTLTFTEPRHSISLWHAIKVAMVMLSSATVAGCINMSGISGSTDSFGCKAPEGIPCTSVSGTYANAVQNNLPGNKAHSQPKPADASTTEKTTKTPSSSGLVPGTPLRSPTRMLRVWFAPNEDADRDFWEERYCFMVVDSGRWMVEHSRASLAEHYRPAMLTPKAKDSSLAPRSPMANQPPARSDIPEQDKGEMPDHPPAESVNNVQ